MKRIAILLLMAMVVTMISVANSFAIPENTIKAEEPEIKISSAKPVIVPYLNKNIKDVTTNERKEKQNAITNRLVKGELSGTEKTEPATGNTEQSSDEYYERVDENESLVEGTGGQQIEEGLGLIYLGNWTITAYCACPICCGEWSTGCTASGVLATANHTLACNSLPFGTQVMIGGIVYTVEDTGYSPYGDAWADIFFDSHEEALAYGVRVEEVWLVG